MLSEAQVQAMAQRCSKIFFISVLQLEQAWVKKNRKIHNNMWSLYIVPCQFKLINKQTKKENTSTL